MKTRRSICIAGTVLFLMLGGAFYCCFRSPRYLAVSPDGRIHFVAVRYKSGTSFSTAFGSEPEAWVREVLFDVGFRKVQRTSFKMTSPPNSHLFILLCSGDIGEAKANYIKAELVQPDGTKYRLIPVGGDRYGIQKRQFAYWVLSGVAHLDRQQSQLKVYLPEDAPTLLPLPK
jgi:hypothetical protein